jgi:hypothetical protein
MSDAHLMLALFFYALAVASHIIHLRFYR